MPKQRTGYIFYDKKRKTWTASLTYKDELGRTRNIKRQVGNKTEGNNLLKKLLNDIDQHSSTIIDGALLTNRYQILRRISSNVFCNYQFKDCDRDCCSPSDSATQYCSTIYQAKDLDLAGRPVTIIEIIGKFTEDLQPLILEKQYKREIELLTRLDHPSIPAIYQFFFDIELGRFYLVMKYIDGSDLATRQRLLGGRVDEFAVTKWAIDICDALDYSHSQSPPILYRDLMPASLMLDEQTNRAMLLDFGIARFLAMLSTGSGHFLFTGYMPREGLAGNFQTRTDIYSLGATMFHLLTGSDPDDNPLLIFDFTKNPKPRQINPAITPEMEEIICKAVESKPENRFASASALCQKLKEHLHNLQK